MFSFLNKLLFSLGMLSARWCMLHLEAWKLGLRRNINLDWLNQGQAIAGPWTWSVWYVDYKLSIGCLLPACATLANFTLNSFVFEEKHFQLITQLHLSIRAHFSIIAFVKSNWVQITSSLLIRERGGGKEEEKRTEVGRGLWGLKEEKETYTEWQREQQRDIKAAYSLKSNKCQLNLLPWFLWKPLKLRVEHRHFLDCNSQAVYLIMMKHETVRDNTVIILIAFRLQQIGMAE